MTDGISQLSLPIAVWILIFLAAFLLEWTRLRLLSVALLGAGYLLAFIAGLVDWRAGIVLVLLLGAAYAIASRRPLVLRVAGHVVFVAVALGLALHVLPGFHNLRPIGPVRFTPDAVPFTMYLNLDKPLAGFWLLLVWPALCLRRDGWNGIGRGLATAAVTTVVCLGLGVVLGKLAFAPKWPHLAWLWALNNLLLVCLAEEALFRGYLQEGLSRRFAERARRGLRHRDCGGPVWDCPRGGRCRLRDRGRLGGRGLRTCVSRRRPPGRGPGALRPEPVALHAVHLSDAGKLIVTCERHERSYRPRAAPSSSSVSSSRSDR